MSIPYSVLPIALPGQSYFPIATPTSPGWSVKESFTWNNHKYQSVSGRTFVVKYWNSPLHKWEFVYEVLANDPSKLNGYYSAPVPMTQFETLKGFYCGMQGSGNMFAYQPADSLRGTGNLSGHSLNVVATQVIQNSFAILYIDPSTPNITPVRLGDRLNFSGFSVATYLNGQNGIVVFNNPVASGTVLGNSYSAQLIVQTVTGGVQPLQGPDTGNAAGGQPLASPDANHNIELVNNIGYYPTTIAPGPAVLASTEAVQLIDTATLFLFDSTGATFSYTLHNPSTVAPYQGYVMTVIGSPVPPMSASFRYYYLCRFSEDTQEFENFMTMLWSCSSLKVDQVRI